MGVAFGVIFFLVLAEKHFFLALIRKICRPVIFFVFHRRGLLIHDKTKRGWQELYGSCPISHRRPLSVVSLLWSEEGEDLYGFSFTLSNDCLVVFLRCVEDVNAPI